MTLAYYTGWRVNSELLSLEWRQIDRQAGAIQLEPGTTKNRDGRVFLYAELDEVRETIEGLWAMHMALERAGVLTPLVFCRRQGQRIRTFWKRWQSESRGRPGNRRDEDHRAQDALGLTATTSPARRISPRRHESFRL